MKREWKPGDVVQTGYLRGFIDTRNRVIWPDGSSNDLARERLGSPLDYLRPLAVIDPEAEIPDEWATVFWAAYDEHPSGDVNECSKAALAALFAHIAAPPEPKPDEPTGDRATVRDRDGVLWTRDNGADPDGPWRDLCGLRVTWAALDVPADGVLWGGVE